jgi:hypothetical protein
MSPGTSYMVWLQAAPQCIVTKRARWSQFALLPSARDGIGSGMDHHRSRLRAISGPALAPPLGVISARDRCAAISRVLASAIVCILMI